MKFNIVNLTLKKIIEQGDSEYIQEITSILEVSNLYSDTLKE